LKTNHPATLIVVTASRQFVYVPTSLIFWRRHLLTQPENTSEPLLTYHRQSLEYQKSK
jgi:hypothetical protein